jgi:hypothetical protein
LQGEEAVDFFFNAETILFDLFVISGHPELKAKRVDCDWHTLPSGVLRMC